MALSRKRKLDSRLVCICTTKKAHICKLLRECICLHGLKGLCKFLTFRKEGELSSKKKGDADVSKKMVRMIGKMNLR